MRSRYVPFRLAISRAAAKRGWTNSRLAAETGISRSRVNEYLTGKCEARGDNIESMCRVLCLTLFPKNGE